MYEFRCPVTAEQVEPLDTHLLENGFQHWTIQNDALAKTWHLCGYFDEDTEGRMDYMVLQSAFAGLPETLECLQLQDRDWKESYKLHFKPINFGGLHWVPLWERDNYQAPAADAVILLDPGMAFGTGAHETTRLCAKRLLETRNLCSKSLANKVIIDAGCGSGILALSAVALGFVKVSGFDIDDEAVRISRENAELNALGGKVQFYTADLENGLKGKKADILLANIQADVLLKHMELLLRSVVPGGVLVLSGILATEAVELEQEFLDKAAVIWGAVHCRAERDGEWVGVTLWRE
ncbi:MAG: 50S ribosomal protein L11 methyltransferase [Verrucomicrobiota bacterium]|nr:50S ribosomal protein L11 methyltransferase [Verrucomicrobiota bacterium]